MNATIGLKFKLDGFGETHEISEISPKKILDITSPKQVHVINTKGTKSSGSPVDLTVAESLIEDGYWVIQ